MTEKQIDEHLQEVIKYAAEIVKVTGDKAWQNYKKRLAEQGSSQIPKVIEETIRNVFNYAYGQGICVGVEDTIIRTNRKFNGGVAGEA